MIGARAWRGSDLLLALSCCNSTRLDSTRLASRQLRCAGATAMQRASTSGPQQGWRGRSGGQADSKGEGAQGRGAQQGIKAQKILWRAESPSNG